jgi:hypothetical protein
MDKFLQILSLWQVVSNVALAAHDKGGQSILKTVSATVNNLVQSGHMPASVTEGIDTILPTVIEAHPAVQNPAPDPVPVVAPAAAPAVAGRNLTDADVAAVVAALKRGGN